MSCVSSRSPGTARSNLCFFLLDTASPSHTNVNFYNKPLTSLGLYSCFINVGSLIHKELLSNAACFAAKTELSLNVDDHPAPAAADLLQTPINDHKCSLVYKVVSMVLSVYAALWQTDKLSKMPPPDHHPLTPPGGLAPSATLTLTEH